MDAIDLETRNIAAGTFGNACFASFAFTLASGDNIASVHKIGRIPSGFRIIDGMLWVSDAGPASTTLDIGFVATAGGSTAQDDPDYLFAVVAASSTGFTRRTVNNEPVTFVQDMYLQVTVQGANQNGAFAGRVGLFYEFVGNL